MKFNIQKKTPASNWTTIHRGFDLETAKEVLVDFAKNYDNDDQKEWLSALGDDGMALQSYERGDLHQFRIVEGAE